MNSAAPSSRNITTMKKLITLLLVDAALVFCTAASAPSYTQGPAFQWRLQVDPQFDAKGALTAATVQAFFHSTFTNTQDPTDAFTKDLGSVSIDTVKDAAKTVVYNGKTYTYAEITGAAAAMCAQEWNAANPP